MSKSGAPDALRALCDTLRAKGGVEWRSAVLAEERVEFLRAKDLATHLLAHPDAMAPFVPGNKSPEEQVRELGQLLLRRRLLVRCERVYKKPRPGMKRLAKWPKKLLPCGAAEQVWAGDGFYAWTYDRPTSPWTYVWSGLLVAAVFAACCFPLAPYWVKVSVLYLSTGLLVLMLGSIALRGLLALLTWLAGGRAVWLFPNMMDETLGLKDAFTPLVAVSPPSDSRGNHWLVRLGVALSAGSLCYLLYNVAPEKGAISDGARHAHDALLEWMNAQPAHKSIGNGTDGAAAQVPEQAAEEPAPEAAPAADVPPPPPHIPTLEEIERLLEGEEEEEEGAGAGQDQRAEL